MDPACGCGNFLVVAYREIRRLENEILIELKALGSLDSEAPELSIVDVDQFFGIEHREYSARIAESALWMTDHVVNNELSLSIGRDFHRIPLSKSPRIVIGDALDIDWSTILEPSPFVHILGNPPYQGSKKQTKERRKKIAEIADSLDAAGTLDLAAGWLIKASAYVPTGAKISFVTTNSIVQGEQVAQLWPLLFDKYRAELFFAHQTFAWITESANQANVHVVILGICDSENAPRDKKLYTYSDYKSQPTMTSVSQISPYLIDGSNLDNPKTVVRSSRNPRNGFNRLKIGSKPIDGGYYILTEAERKALLSKDSGLERFIRPFIGADEFLYGNKRYIIYLGDASPQDIAKHKSLRGIIKKVRRWRNGEIPNKKGNSFRKSPDKLADTPLAYHVTVVPSAPFLVIPEVTSEKREYIPIGWLEPPTIPSNLVKVSEEASLTDFALLTSAMHMAWSRIIGGKLESRYRYSIGILYNNFPIPPADQLAGLAARAQKVVDARANHLSESLENLYDPDLMPSDLRSAHKSLDRAVDIAYLGKPASDDQERIEHLLNMYEAVQGM
jgi:hypothetical protein